MEIEEIIYINHFGKQIRDGIAPLGNNNYLLYSWDGKYRFDWVPNEIIYLRKLDAKELFWFYVERGNTPKAIIFRNETYEPFSILFVKDNSIYRARYNGKKITVRVNEARIEATDEYGEEYGIHVWAIIDTETAKLLALTKTPYVPRIFLDTEIEILEEL